MSKEMCDCGRIGVNHLGLCDVCYKEMFDGVENGTTCDEGFYLENDVATIKEAEPSLIYVNSDKQSFTLHSLPVGFFNPKRMVFNPDCRVKDYEALLVFLLNNIPIYENAKGFDKVSYMFKEAE
jgi:hypothetical protein